MKRDATVKAVDAGQRLSLRDEQKNLTRRRVLDAAVAGTQIAPSLLRQWSSTLPLSTRFISVNELLTRWLIR